MKFRKPYKRSEHFACLYPIWWFEFFLGFDRRYDYNDTVPWVPAPDRVILTERKPGDNQCDFQNFDNDEKSKNELWDLVFCCVCGKDKKEKKWAYEVAALSKEDQIAHKKAVERLEIESNIAVQDEARIAECQTKHGRKPMKRSDFYLGDVFPLWHLVYNQKFDPELDVDDTYKGVHLLKKRDRIWFEGTDVSKHDLDYDIWGFQAKKTEKHFQKCIGRYQSYAWLGPKTGVNTGFNFGFGVPGKKVDAQYRL